MSPINPLSPLHPMHPLNPINQQQYITSQSNAPIPPAEGALILVILIFTVIVTFGIILNNR